MTILHRDAELLGIEIYDSQQAPSRPMYVPLERGLVTRFDLIGLEAVIATHQHVCVTAVDYKLSFLVVHLPDELSRVTATCEPYAALQVTGCAKAEQCRWWWQVARTLRLSCGAEGEGRFGDFLVVVHKAERRLFGRVGVIEHTA